MGLFSDLKEVKSIWHKANNIEKFILVISAFLTVSSITSLSDLVFHWKSFILEGVNFYHQYIRVLFSYPFQLFGLTFHSYQLDIICINSILLGGVIRSFHGYLICRALWKHIVATLFFIIFFLAIIFTNLRNTFFDSVGLVILRLESIVLISLSLITLILSGICLRYYFYTDDYINKLANVMDGLGEKDGLYHRERYVESMSKDRIRFFSVPIFSITIVLILAAINEGISR